MEFIVISFLILLNGFFALSEIALVSSKRSRLEQLAAQGKNGARSALKLMDNSEGFLSAIQVGITLIGIVTGMYGGISIADDLTPLLERLSFIAPYAHEISLTATVVVITFVTILIGELAPKSIALSNPEPIAAIVAPVIRIFSRLFYPFVRILSACTNLVKRVLGIRNKQVNMTEAELRHIIRIARREGVIEAEQTLLHEKVFYFANKKAKHVMTHRRDVQWVDLDDPVETQLQYILLARHNKLVVGRGSLDGFAGVLSVIAFLITLHKDPKASVADHMTEPLIIPETMGAQSILNLFRTKQQYFSIVVSEYGSFEGIVTLHDLMENIVGDIPEEGEISEPDMFVRNDQSILINGDAAVETLASVIDNFSIDFENMDFASVGGFVLHYLERVPQTGDTFDFQGYTIEVLDMDGAHVDKILITKTPAS